MIGFNHTLAGAVIAIIAPSPFQPLLAFMSHFALDMLPHFGRHPRFIPWTSGFKKLLLLDAVVCFTVLAYAIILFPDKWGLLIICTAAATLPDFMWLLEKYAGRRTSWFFDFHHKIQWGERPYGWILEFIYFIIGIIWLYTLSK